MEKMHKVMVQQGMEAEVEAEPERLVVHLQRHRKQRLFWGVPM